MTDPSMPIRPATDQSAHEANSEPNRDTLLGVPNPQRQFQPDHLQSGSHAGQDNSNNEYGSVPEGNTNSSANYHNGRAAPVPNMQTANTQVQNPFPLTRDSQMFAAAGQRSLPPNARPYPLLSQLAFVETPPTAPNIHSSSNQDLRNQSRASTDATNRSSLVGQQSQPHSQLITPVPRPPFPFWGIYFQNFEQVNAYINEVAWFPSMGRYGLPQSAEQYRFYLQKISSALLNIQDVWDIETAPWQLGKFLPNGEWTDPRDIEAISHIVVLAGMRIHVSGVTDFAHTRSVDYMSFNSDDIDFTFPQRMHFVAIMLHHSKGIAAEVMAKANIDKYIASPITTLRTFEPFEENWNKASPEEQKSLIEVVPYIGSGVTHPSPELQAQLAAMAAARYRQVYTAREKRDPGTGSTGNERGQAPGGLGSPFNPSTNAGQSRAQTNARAAGSGSSDRSQCTAPHSSQKQGEDASSPETSGG